MTNILSLYSCGIAPTDRADDAGAAELLRRGVLSVEVGDPFGASTAIVLVLVGVAHDAGHAGQVFSAGLVVVLAVLFALCSLGAMSIGSQLLISAPNAAPAPPSRGHTYSSYSSPLRGRRALGDRRGEENV